MKKYFVQYETVTRSNVKAYLTAANPDQIETALCNKYLVTDIAITEIDNDKYNCYIPLCDANI